MISDYILQILEQFMKLIRALLNKKDDASQVQKDQILSELSGLNIELFNRVDDPEFLLGLLKVIKDDNRTAMICILLHEKDEMKFRNVVDELLKTISLGSLAPSVQSIFESIFKVGKP